MKLSVPVAFGVEASVKRQLRQLGYGDCPALQGRIRLNGDWLDVARLNINLRAGERVLVELAEFPAPDFDALFDGVYSIPWEEYIGADFRILMDGKCVNSRLMAIKTSGGIAKKAPAVVLSLPWPPLPKGGVCGPRPQTEGSRKKCLPLF